MSVDIWFLYIHIFIFSIFIKRKDNSNMGYAHAIYKIENKKIGYIVQIQRYTVGDNLEMISFY